MKLFRTSKNKKQFTEIFKKNLFLGQESVSGQGSDMKQTQVIRVEIPKILEKLNSKVFIDASCGDFFWMQHMDLKGFNYFGLDIVSDLIKKNKKLYSSSKIKFICKDIISDKLPDGDVILIRDCWVHLSNKDIFLCINNLQRNNIQYLLTTSFTQRCSNKDLDGIWRPLNLELPPFNFPKPIEIINEGCTENDGTFSDKSLLLWKICQLPDYKN